LTVVLIFGISSFLIFFFILAVILSKKYQRVAESPPPDDPEDQCPVAHAVVVEVQMATVQVVPLENPKT
jgi:hypothetical protein